MDHRLGSAAGGLLALLAVAACSPSLELPDGGFSLLPDRALSPPPAAPIIPSPPPRVTPYKIVSFKGTAEGRRVYITANGLNPAAATLSTGGSFCVDVQITNPGTYLFDVQAYDADNQVGAPLMDKISVTYDPSAPEIPTLKTCQGVYTAGCDEQIEICDDMEDNDCNGLQDLLDPACRTCEDDIYEPNDDQAAPSVQPGHYPVLKLCSGNPDYYGIFIKRGERIRAQIDFMHAEGDLAFDLLGPRATEMEDRRVLTRSDTQTDGEAVVYTATVTGVHMLSVYGTSGTENNYAMTITLDN